MLYLKSCSHFLFELTFSVAAYLTFFYFNQYITIPLEVSKGVNWIFLPAGLRIFLTLIFDYSGALGLAVASLVINYFGSYEYDLTATIGLAVICALTPLIGRHFVIRNLKVLPDLSNLSFSQILYSILIYSLLSSGLHQLWFSARNLDQGSWNNFMAMFIGDVVGSLLFVAIIKYSLDFLKGRLGRDNLIE